MKKIYSVLVVMLMIAGFPAVAQTGLYVGIAGTVQSTWITNQNNYGLSPLHYSSTFGGSGNINVGYDFTKHIGVKIELGYGQYGQDYSRTITDSTFKRNVKMNYFMLPVMLKFRSGGALAKFYLAVGPQFNFLLSAKQSYLLNSKAFMDTLQDLSGKSFIAGDEGIKDRFASMDILARVDLGVEITLVKKLMIDLGLKLGYGLMDLNDSDYRIKDNTGNYNPSHIVTGGLTLGLNYRL